MKIAMLGHKRMPSREGGVEVVVEELSTRMVALGHEVTVYSRKGHNAAGKKYDQKDTCEYKGVAVKQVATFDIKGLAALTSSYFATKAAIADRPDVIHFHAEGPCAMIGMAKRKGIRTVATIHGLDWQRAKWGRFASWYIKHGEKIAANGADEIIVLSKGVQEYFLKEYDRDTVFVPNGISKPDAKVDSNLISKYGLEKGEYILYLGRLVPEKGAHYLIGAFKRIDTGKKLVIAGGSSDSAAYYEKIKKLSCGDSRIVMTGFMQGDILAELYAKAYIYVLPSDLEGMPMSLLEAMSYGKCCVTSDIAECADVLGNAGVLFEQGDINSLERVLRDLLDDPARVHELGIKAQKQVLERNDWDAVVDRTLCIYRKDPSKRPC